MPSLRHELRVFLKFLSGKNRHWNKAYEFNGPQGYVSSVMAGILYQFGWVPGRSTVRDLVNAHKDQILELINAIPDELL